MKVRLSVRDGRLCARDGSVVGSVEAITVDVDLAALGALGAQRGSQTAKGARERGDYGGLNVGTTERLELTNPAEDSTVGGGKGGSRGETEPREFGEQIDAVWDYWTAHRRPRRQDLEPANERLLRRAFREGYAVDDLKAAIDALLASDYHRERSLLRLSSLLATRPGGPTFRDQLDSWIERGRSLTPVERGGMAGEAVAAAKRMVREAWGRDASLVTAGLQQLARHGLTAVDEGGKPKFISLEREQS